MDLNLKGKNALVCGSSKGIGKASAIEIAKLGANVTLVSRSPEIMAEIIPQLDHSKGQQHDFLQADFTNSSDLKRKIDLLTTGKPIHILINNTGGPPGGPIVDAQVEEFVQAYHNHLICNHILVQAVLKGMKQAQYGRVINIISTSVKAPIDGLGVSNTTRGAVASWAKTMANEVASFGITVNNVLPGFTKTERLYSIIEKFAQKQGVSTEEQTKRMEKSVPANRFAEPEEVGAVVAFLASPASGYINGINVPVDGGRLKNL